MKKPLNDVTQFICNTPLMELPPNWKGNSRLFVKMEYIQPGGSIKDRAALKIISDAYKNGHLKKGQPVVEMTSGNMGAGLAVVCGVKKNPFIAVMSKGNSIERIRILKALGSEVVLVPQVDGSPGKVTGSDIAAAVEKAKEIQVERGAYYVDQFNNLSSVSAHYTTTGPEIWQDLIGEVDAFVSSIGSGGTFIGTSRYLKEKNNNIFCAAVEPNSAAIIKTGKVDNPKHIIQGTGYSLIPPHWDNSLVDDIITVTDKEVENQTRMLAKEHGLYVGYSSGANVCAAKELISSGKLKEYSTVVTVLCDTAFKYSQL
jgi:cysteine synthase